MEKPADVAYPIHDLLRQRWSPRAFADTMVEPEKLQSLFEAARWAPSSSNDSLSERKRTHPCMTGL